MGDFFKKHKEIILYVVFGIITTVLSWGLYALFANAFLHLADISFEDLTASLQEQLGDDFYYYDLKVFYLCPECREKMKNQKMQI